MSNKSFKALYAKVEPTAEYQAEKLAVGFLAELNAFMRANGVSNAELARRANVSPAYITKLFRGPSNLSIETLTKLSDALGCKVHMHLASHGADVRWFDLIKSSRSTQHEINPDVAQFVKVMGQMPSNQEEYLNDEKFALAA
ncbi:MAG: helix-turn-helix transcriptional regulator [Acidovorax sp.]|nr:helix-turn-helix transcriptional regulator [Acidovorax sp.]